MGDQSGGVIGSAPWVGLKSSKMTEPLVVRVLEVIRVVEVVRVALEKMVVIGGG